MRMLVTMMALLLAVPQAFAQDAGAVRTAIEAAMRDSAAGWDAGDVDRFLAVYSDDPATSFTTARGIERGKANIRTRYLATYTGQFGPAAGPDRTRLGFTFEDLRLVGPDHALLTARWRLDAPATGKSDTGMTTLVFRREAGGWKIVADHSS